MKKKDFKRCHKRLIKFYKWLKIPFLSDSVVKQNDFKLAHKDLTNTLLSYLFTVYCCTFKQL